MGERYLHSGYQILQTVALSAALVLYLELLTKSVS